MSKGSSDEDPKKIQEKCDNVTDNTLESTRRMLAMCEESQELGVRTITNLERQGEQLDNIGMGLDKIGNNMTDVEESLNELGKCCGLFKLPWKRRQSIERSGNYCTTLKEGHQPSSSNPDGPRVVKLNDDFGDSGITSSNYIARITNDERENEMDVNIRAVGGIVTNLKNMAIDMGTELGSQNVQLDDLKLKANTNVARVNDAGNKVTKILDNA